MDINRQMAELNAVDWNADRRYQVQPICGLIYPGPDPLGVGMGLCVTPHNLWHNEHVDRHGRTWKTEEQTRLGLPASFPKRRKQ